MPRLNIGLLGPPIVELDGHPIEVDTRKAIALLSFLAVTGQAHARETIAAMLWPESDQSRALAALRRTLSSLNRALDKGRIRTEGSTLALSRDGDVRLDVETFQARLSEVVGHHQAGEELCSRCIKNLEATIELYRDDFMAGFTLRDSPDFDEWQFFQTQSLQRAYATGLDKLTRAYASQGRLVEAIDLAGRLLALDPLNESAHRHLMQLYAYAGDRSAALQQYRECARVLQDELGVAPLKDTNRLYERIKQDRVAPEAGRRGLLEVSLPEPSAAVTEAGPAELPLVGRRGDLQMILQRYQNVQQDGYFVVLEGEAGVGKTRLVEELASLLADQGARVAATRAYEGESGLAYGAVADALDSVIQMKDEAAWWRSLPQVSLAEAGRLLPDIASQHPEWPSLPPLGSPGARTRFFEAISQILLAMARSGRPGALLVDNLHWADEATQDLLAYLVRRLRGHPILIVVTWRTEHVSPNHRFRRWLGQAQRQGLGTSRVLSALDRRQVDELMTALGEAGLNIPSELKARLFEVTQGLPFFISEYLAVLQRGSLEAMPHRWELPSGVRQLLESHLASVGETETQLLGAAAVIGRSFEFDVLRDASGRGEEETVRGLERLQGAGLITEVASASGQRLPAYDFKHEQLRELMLSNTSQARKRLLHRRVAEALIRAGGRGKLGGQSGKIGHHLAQAGEEGEAAEYFKQAGDWARALYANAEALGHYKQALSLGHPKTPELREAIGDLHTLLGDYGDALARYEAAAASLAEEDLARMERKLGGVYERRGDWGLAESHYEAAVEALGDSVAPAELARIYADWSLLLHRAGQSPRAVSLAERALDLAQGAQDRRALAQIHNILGILARSRGSLAEARDHLEASLSSAQALSDAFVETAALNNMALVLGDSGDHQAALELARRALSLCRKHGDRHREAALETNIADLLHASGETEAAMPHLKRAAAIFGEIGVAEGTYQPEIWKLVEW